MTSHRTAAWGPQQNPKPREEAPEITKGSYRANLNEEGREGQVTHVPEELHGQVPGWTQTQRARERPEPTVLKSFNYDRMAVPQIKTLRLKRKSRFSRGRCHVGAPGEKVSRGCRWEKLPVQRGRWNHTEAEAASAMGTCPFFPPGMFLLSFCS